MKKLLKSIFFVSLLLIPSVHAGWIGPSVVLSGGWGNEAQQFFVDWGDTPAYAVLPGISDIASDGLIAIADDGHFKLYRNDGQWIRNVIPPYNLRWGVSPRFVGNNIVLPINELYFLSREGILITQSASRRNDFIGERNDNLYLAAREPRLWQVYSANGNLLNTVTEKPLELGRIKDDLFIYQEQKLHRVTVSFPNRQWVIAGSGGSCGEYNYFVDNAGFLHCIGTKKVVRYSACGKPIASLNMPEDNIATLQTAPPGSGAEDNMEIVEGFGVFEIADNGDLYTSHFTQQNYSVIRWAWQNSSDDSVGGPDAPVELTVTANSGVVALRWMPSLQDPGCVTTYEVSRSTTAGGPYTALATVARAGVDEPYTYTDSTAQSETIYYYTIRAVSAIGNSTYSNEVSAQR